jgi:Cys-tRNA(Pro)/Cys-tRNA(Cys) deacylase
MRERPASDKTCGRRRDVDGEAVRDRATSPGRRYTRRMARSTRATQELSRAGVAYDVHEYAYDPGADRVGLQAAAALGADPGRVLKTLLASVDGLPVCAIVPSDREVDMKRLAAAFGGRRAQMLAPADAERLSGYHVGGISPFGLKKRVPVAIEAGSFDWPRVYVNGGQRGLQVELAPADAARVLGAQRAALVA